MKMISKKLSFRKFTGFLMAALAVTTFASCSDDDTQNEDNARIIVHMTDAPGDYEEVNVEVLDVMIKADGNSDDEGWTSLGGIRTGVYDLLSLTGGVTQLLADAEVAPGPLGQIRLVLGNDNTVVIDGESQALSTPSAQQSGLKLQVNQTLEAGNTYEFLLDFDVDASIVEAGSSGGFILKPVIRMATLEGTGTITGEVQPSLLKSHVKAANSTTTISAYTDENGNFSLNGVPAGTYQITVTPVDTGLSVKTVNNVIVASGATVDLDVIFID